MPAGPLTRWTTKKGRAFIDALRESGNVTRAAHAARISRQTAYNHRESDPEFGAEWDEAIEQATDDLEAEARRRALDGVEEPVYQQGGQVGTIRRYSDTLLIFLLKGHRPAKYRERYDIGSEPGRPVLTKNEGALSVMNLEQLKLLAAGIDPSAAKGKT